jgi:hypothetical protein
MDSREIRPKPATVRTHHEEVAVVSLDGPLLSVVTFEPGEAFAANPAGKAWAPKKATIGPSRGAPYTWIFLPNGELAAASCATKVLAVRCGGRRTIVGLS